jgi:phenylpropionate dioxygenase-like ring-hydroxylating dioxygenase large terminal subunit
VIPSQNASSGTPIVDFAAEDFPRALSGEWIAVGAATDLNRDDVLKIRVAGADLRVWDGPNGDIHAGLADGRSVPDLRFTVMRAYGLIWLCHGAPARALFSLPEYAEPDGRIVHCGAFGVRTSPLRAVENFLDMGHFPFVHTDILGEEPYTRVNNYRVEPRPSVDELWALDCVFHQPRAAAAAATAQDSRYTYRVVSPFNVILYKSPPAPMTGNDVICLFAQPLAEDRVRTHLLMVLKDDTSTMSDMIAFQQLIFSQDKPILENQVPSLMPLTGSSEKPVRADAMSMAYRKWLLDKDWTYGAIRRDANPT